MASPETLPDITYVLFVKNEEHRLEYALRPLKGKGHIMIVDDVSTDGTQGLARRYTREIYMRERKAGWVEDEETVNFVLERAKTQWLFWLFADEIVHPVLAGKLAALVARPELQIIWTYRRNYNYGGVNLNNDYTLRCFRRGAVDFKGNTIGSFGKVIAPQSAQHRLPKNDAHAIHHFSTYTLERFELAHGKYSMLEAKDNLRAGKRPTAARLILRPLYFFLRDMLKGGAWRSGLRGFIIAAEYAFFYFSIYAKMWELEHGVTQESMEAGYAKTKEKLLENADHKS